MNTLRPENRQLRTRPDPSELDHSQTLSQTIPHTRSESQVYCLSNRSRTPRSFTQNLSPSPNPKAWSAAVTSLTPNRRPNSPEFPHIDGHTMDVQGMQTELGDSGKTFADSELTGLGRRFSISCDGAVDRQEQRALLRAGQSPRLFIRNMPEQYTYRTSVPAPPTPPTEKDFADWLTHATSEGTQRSGRNESHLSASSVDPPTQQASESGGGQAPLPMQSQSEQSGFQPSANGVRLIDAIRSATRDMRHQTQTSSTRIISQVMPSHATDYRNVKTYEAICEHLQSGLPRPRYIQIHHALALSQGQGVQDFPRSPPATPNYRGGDSYFGEQMVFTHVNQIVMHHEFRRTHDRNLLPIQRYVMPGEADIVLLERYLPPTTTEEVADFFNADSDRSYLADRLPELTENGSMLVVYPTAQGARSFASQCVGPILDPLLRQMSILRGLGTDAAQRLGSMKSLEAMPEFAEIEQKLEKLCSSMNTRHSSRGNRGHFHLVSSTRAQVVLDQKTWLAWFVDQEQQRFKQDLIDYHQQGGRLPQADAGASEITAGMLAREIVTGLEKSQDTNLLEPLEVGVFVLRRSGSSRP